MNRNKKKRTLWLAAVDLLIIGVVTTVSLVFLDTWEVVARLGFGLGLSAVIVSVLHWFIRLRISERDEG